MKRKHSMTYICESAVTKKSPDVCWVYFYMYDVVIGSAIRFAYSVSVPMTIFHIFACKSYLPRFFGVWTLEIFPMWDNMVWMVIDYNNIGANICTHTNREAGFQF
jgi:hypothetical protein